VLDYILEPVVGVEFPKEVFTSRARWASLIIKWNTSANKFYLLKMDPSFLRWFCHSASTNRLLVQHQQISRNEWLVDVRLQFPWLLYDDDGFSRHRNTCLQTGVYESTHHILVLLFLIQFHRMWLAVKSWTILEHTWFRLCTCLRCAFLLFFLICNNT
jgi:hypothetical protein